MWELFNKILSLCLADSLCLTDLFCITRSNSRLRRARLNYTSKQKSAIEISYVIFESYYQLFGCHFYVEDTTVGVVKVLSNIKFVFFAEIRQRLITSGSANRSSPTLTTPKCINNIKKLSLLHSYSNEPFAACGLCEKQINFEYNQKPLY